MESVEERANSRVLRFERAAYKKRVNKRKKYQDQKCWGLIDQ